MYYGNGYYPSGAAFDPRAPWNAREPAMVTCEACGGKGCHWYAYDFTADRDTECSELQWLALPDTEEEAVSLGLTCIKGEKETCDVCDGNGEIEYEPDYDDYDDDDC